MKGNIILVNTVRVADCGAGGHVGATRPFENSTISDADGHFHFAKVPAGTCTVAIVTADRGEEVQTIEVSKTLVDSKGRLDIALKLDASKLES